MSPSPAAHFAQAVAPAAPRGPASALLTPQRIVLAAMFTVLTALLLMAIASVARAQVTRGEDWRMTAAQPVTSAPMRSDLAGQSEGMRLDAPGGALRVASAR